MSPCWGKGKGSRIPGYGPCLVRKGSRTVTDLVWILGSTTECACWSALPPTHRPPFLHGVAAPDDRRVHPPNSTKNTVPASRNESAKPCERAPSPTLITQGPDSHEKIYTGVIPRVVLFKVHTCFIQKSTEYIKKVHILGPFQHKFLGICMEPSLNVMK